MTEVLSGMEYAFFVVRRVPCDKVTFPDGTVSSHPLGEGHNVLRQWWEDNVAAPSRSEYSAAWNAWEQRRAQFVAQTTVERTDIKRDVGGIRKQRVAVDRITFPDGQSEHCELGQATQRAFERFAETSSEPQDPIPDYDVWRRQQAQRSPLVQPGVAWDATLFRDAENQPISIQSRDWNYGLPVEEVLATLNTLAGEGWVVVQISEDRGLYQGIAANNDAWVTRARYLLARAHSSLRRAALSADEEQRQAL
jgi:hypothetical protein